MNAAHIHILLNHVPTTGFGVALGLLLVAFVRKDEYLSRVSLVAIFLVALLAIPSYISGNAAQQMLQDRTDVSQVLIRAHEDAVLPGYAVMELVGFLAWLGLWQYRVTLRLPRWNLITVLSLSIVAFSLMAWAAVIGGEIRHPEIRSGDEVASTKETASVGGSEWIESFVADHTWVRPSCETIHFLGLSLLFTVVLLVDLRMLGVAKVLTYSSLYQLLPLGILGFGLNLLTGMVFFIATPNEFMKNSIFFWKIILMVLAGLNSLYFVLFDEPWSVGRGDDAPLTAKAVAASTICLWVGVLFFGHMLPFLGHAF